MLKVLELLQKKLKIFNKDDNEFKILIGDSSRSEITPDAPTGGLTEYGAGDYKTRIVLPIANYGVSGTDAFLTSPDDNFDQDDNFIPISCSFDTTELNLNNDGNRYIWDIGNQIGPSKTFIAVGVGSIYGALELDADSNYDLFAGTGTEYDGIQRFNFPKSGDDDKLGGYHDFYYLRAAFVYAFTGNHVAAVFAQNGSVYKGSILAANLVVRHDGQTGPAGSATPEVSVDSVRVVYTATTIDDTSDGAGFLPMQTKIKDAQYNLGDYKFNCVALTGTGRTLTGQSVGAAEGTFILKIIGTGNWHSFASVAYDGIQSIVVPNSATIEFYFIKKAFQDAFFETNSDMIVTTDFSVYKGSVANENLVVNGSGETGPAAEITIIQKINNINTGAITNSEEYLKRLSLYLIDQMNLQLTSEDWLTWAGDVIYGIPRIGGESDRFYIDRIVDTIFAVKTTPVSIENALLDYADDVEVDDDVSSGAFSDVTFSDYFLEFESVTPIYQIEGTDAYIVRGAIVGATGGLPFHFYVILTNPDLEQADTIVKIINNFRTASTVASILKI